MTCRQIEELVLDLARGVDVPDAAQRAVEAHLHGCVACAVGLRRQRQLTAGLRELAARAREWTAAAGIEERLLAAFAAQAPAAATGSRQRARHRWLSSLAAAAVLALAVWGGVRGVQIFRPKAARTHAQPGELVTRGSGERKTAAELVNGSAGERNTTADPASLRAETVRRTNRRLAATRPGTTRLATGAPGTRPAENRAPAPPPEVSRIDFVRIPSAMGLPDFESGTVVRVELPLGALPEYGLEISPGAMHHSVEADILVGQDGQPRAIRLVGTADRAAQESGSRR